jgi:hypothetical protein
MIKHTFLHFRPPAILVNELYSTERAAFRIAEIPSGIQMLKFTNIHDKIAVVFLGINPFIYVNPKTFVVIQSVNLINRFPMRDFPKWELYSSLSLHLEFITRGIWMSKDKEEEYDQPKRVRKLQN